MKSLMLCAAIVCLLVSLAAVGAASAADDKLVVTQDESSMERVIEGYLKAKHDLTIDEKKDGDDLMLEVPMKGDPMPKYHFLVDTQPLNTNDDGLVIERGVRTQLFTGIKVPADKQPEVMATINGFNRDKVFSAAYLDTDGEIVIDWTLNVMAQGLATEYVFDVLARLNKLWAELYPMVTKQLE